GHARAAEFISSEDLRVQLQSHFLLHAEEPPATTTNSAGPARYWRVPGYDSRIGIISPHSENFCNSCNRIRVTATGRLLLCLGQENSIDLRAHLRQFPTDVARLQNIIINALQHKPLQHDFNLADEPQILRFMNATGG